MEAGLVEGRVMARNVNGSNKDIDSIREETNTEDLVMGKMGWGGV